MKRVALVAGLLVLLGAVVETRAEPTGSALPGLGSYDELMTALIKKWEVPGAGLAVAYRGRLLLVRGYGLVGRQGQGEEMAGWRPVRTTPVRTHG